MVSPLTTLPGGSERAMALKEAMTDRRKEREKTIAKCKNFIFSIVMSRFTDSF
jgi:hypothetical protein